ncbi:MAG: NAD(P)-dependent oxidoreductase [Deltaproteobacteria bacterium]|nr:NAD(P)-dependent oxidoreductase [Deltaproteobacteria bacterium]
MTLFVTGSESFIGRALFARCRLHGIHAVGIDSAAPAGGGSRQADIRDPGISDLIPEGATVVHLAAISRDSDCRTDPRGAFDINVTGTLNVAAAAKKRNSAQLIFASSEWVYGDVRNDEVQVEDRPIDVTMMKSEYALTKIVGEQCLRIGCALPAVTVLRFGIVYGPRPSNWSAVENLFNAARTQDEIKIGSSKTARRFIHVDDIVSGILASRRRLGFEIFNLSGNAPISLGDIIDTSAKLWKRHVKIVETNPSQPSIRNPDNAKARTELDWQPKFDLSAGLADLKRFFDGPRYEGKS